MSDYIVYQGTLGWSHDAWMGDFYPEDMPEDWQLSFYNTQFRCVYLPFEQWRHATDEEVAGWLCDTQEGFRFVLGVPRQLGEDDKRKAGRFGKRAIQEDDANVIWIEDEPDLRELARHMQSAAKNGRPLFLISREAALGALRSISELMQVLGV